MKDVNVISLDSAEEDQDEAFAEFIETVKSGNDGVVFLISKTDGTLSLGSTAKSAKDLLWDSYRLQIFMQELVREGS